MSEINPYGLLTGGYEKSLWRDCFWIEFSCQVHKGDQVIEVFESRFQRNLEKDQAMTRPYQI